MKIIILTDVYLPYVGGGQIYLSNVLQHICKQNDIEIEIVTRKLIINGKIIGRNENQCAGKLKITRLGFPAAWDNIFARLGFIFFAVFYLLNKNFDLIDVQAFIGAIPGKIISVLKKKPIILTIHGTTLETGHAGMIEKIILTKIKYDAQISAASNFLKFKNVNKKINIVTPGVDSSFYKHSLSKKEKKRILFVGRLQKIKGTESLYRCISTLKHWNYKWVIVGDGEEMKSLKDKIKAAGISHVEFTGSLRREKTLEEYQKASIFFLPSWSEGFPLTLLEAMACGLPCVASNVGDIASLVKDNVNGFIVKSGDIKNFAESIQKISQDDKLRKQISANNIEKSGKYSWNKSADKIYQIYKKYD